MEHKAKKSYDGKFIVEEHKLFMALYSVLFGLY